jgi:hypothetical protein
VNHRDLRRDFRDLDPEQLSVILGSVTSTPPGAAGLRVAAPVTAKVSSPQARRPPSQLPAAL